LGLELGLWLVSSLSILLLLVAALVALALLVAGVLEDYWPGQRQYPQEQLTPLRLALGLLSYQLSQATLALVETILLLLG
jgi:hypothetical protein